MKVLVKKAYGSDVKSYLSGIGDPFKKFLSGALNCILVFTSFLFFDSICMRLRQLF